MTDQTANIIKTTIAGFQASLIDCNNPYIGTVVAAMRNSKEYEGQLIGEYGIIEGKHYFRIYPHFTNEDVHVGELIAYHYANVKLFDKSVAEFFVPEAQYNAILTNKEKWALCIDARKFDEVAKVGPVRVTSLIDFNPHLRSRTTCEREFQFLQPILYAAIRCSTTGRIFSYSRASTSGETRLVGKHSIGIGGHIDIVPQADFVGMMADEALREFQEEVGLKTTKELRNQLISKLESGQFLYIRNKEEEVDAVHLGFAMVVDIERESDLTKIEDSEIQSPKWLTLTECQQYSTEGYFESWSKIFTRHLSQAK